MVFEIGGRSGYIDSDSLRRILGQLQPVNRVACVFALRTGLRIDDVLRIRRRDVARAVRNNYWLTVTERKTGKPRKIHIDGDIAKELTALAGSVYIFEHRSDPDRHRTRQTVYKDFKRCCRAVLGADTNASVHSLRKVYAVDKYRETGSLERVKNSLNHNSVTTTMLYAFADKL